ncbi:uncharacterized protein LOC122282198 [Carya illinoinensis]|uniref:uncharacterized protein LOC122282198 n=1 Tax=Carya illinoinensis TaxID=32201 RepID=UPI001C72107B|nr:uncharacterized protein LOC122282198 [Carya illinoinensis]
MPQDSSTRACHDNVHELGPSSVRQACSEREIKPVKSGKVKYISLDEVIMLSAAASKKGASARSNSDSKPGSLSSMKPLRNSLAGSRAAASKSSASMVKSNRSLGPSDPVKHPRHGGGVSSMVDQQVPQTSKKLKDGNFRDVDECKISDVDETDLLNVVLKFRLYHYNLPAVDATWKGGFHLSATCKFYGGFQAQPSCIINRKAFDFSKGMPSVLQVEFVPRSQIWANLFHDNYPDVSDIALYFFTADNIESSKEDMNCLFELMDVHKSMMKSHVDGAELLIFISKDLYLPSQSEFSLCSCLHFYIVASAFPYG